MSRVGVANLQLRSNLLSAPSYPTEMLRITYTEIRDIWQRNPALKNEDRLTEEQLQQHRDNLFAGAGLVSLNDDDRLRQWLQEMMPRIGGVVAELEMQPDLEMAFEVLIVTETLGRLDCPDAKNAHDLTERVRVLLGRPEFGLDCQRIDQRLNEILDR